MIKTITPEICKKLEEIGFDDGEINTIGIIHELNTREYSIDIKKLINQVAFEKLSKGIGETFVKGKWGNEDFFGAVENLRKEKNK
ncbi:MAG: hypothetical protein K8F52_14755 [Candidatus Scalindua rubra]|uniref:Uncharacterized protein n=1 Tax=Candidatus Scalindua brodae TaxID=237368 RepID=A0A0B0EL91_9BACT|nr:MAG: hypothetical protein SCABRO_02818 [Candidatus Scalindua brodae]MBZ0109909.1 hypothetical protein [Candidatus Scalindua rubra]